MTTAGGPVYVSPFLGAGADWLCLLDPDLVPLVSWMGGKRRLARDILALLGLRPGHPIPALLGDASWWGWVWPTVLDADTGPRVSEVLRSWRGEDPRALWFRLRDLGPIEDRAGAAAQMLWLQARAASGVPVWWEAENAVKFDGGMDGNIDRARQMHANEPIRELLASPGDRRTRQVAANRGSNGRTRLLQEAGSQIDDAGQTRTNGVADPRLIQMANGRGPYASDRLLASARGGDPPAELLGGRENGGASSACAKGKNAGGAGGIIDPGTIADRADAVRARLVKASGGEAGFSRDYGTCVGKGWRLFGPGDVADRVDAVRIYAIGAATFLHTDARTMTDAWAPRLGSRAMVYLDPPYQGATGYPVACARDHVLAIAEMWAQHGARVVLSEAVGLAAELGPGWTQARLRAAPKPEWVTVFNCDVRDIMPPFLRAIWGTP